MLDWKEPLALDGLIDRGLKLFNAVLPRALLLAVACAVANELVTEQVLGGEEPRLLELITQQRFVELVEAYGLAFAALGVFGMWNNSAVLHFVGASARGTAGEAFASLGAALRAMPQLILGSLVALAIALAGLGALLALHALGVLPEALRTPLFALAIAQGVWAVIALAFNNQAVLFDGQDGISAVRTSLRYTRGQWWRTLGFFLLLFVALLIVIVLASLAVGLVAGVVGVVAGAAGAKWTTMLLMAALVAVVGLVVQALVVCYYHDLALRAGAAAPNAPGTLTV